MLTFNLAPIPFSRYGSYLAVSRLVKADSAPEGLYLRTVRGPNFNPNFLRPVLEFQLLSVGEPVPFEETASPTELELQAGPGRVTLYYPRADVLRVRAEGVSLRLRFVPSDFANIIPRKGRAWLATTLDDFESKLLLTPLSGELRVDAPWDGRRCEHVVVDLHPCGDTPAEMLIEDYWIAPSGYAPEEGFEAGEEKVKAEFATWMEGIPKVPAPYENARALAGYLLWASAVHPAGHLKRNAVYMSKNWMASIWSWDHCFNAMALAAGHPELAWDQFMVMFDNQAPNGQVPDLISDAYEIWGFSKPPVHGWTLLRLFDMPGFMTHARMREIYEPLKKWTEWWFRERDDDGDGIPQYNHGNDSGWDNGTIFTARPPVESPDLSAYLVLQMEALGKLAGSLGLEAEARGWENDARQLLERLLAHFREGDRFVARSVPAHEAIESESLIVYMPLLLGLRLPQDVRASLVEGLRGFLTTHGMASERPSSPLFDPDGYWRGAIWGAPTMMLIQGLEAIGETAFAGDIRRKFCDMVENGLDYGIGENYNPLTGRPLRDPAFTWTSSIFLVLANELL